MTLNNRKEFISFVVFLVSCALLVDQGAAFPQDETTELSEHQDISENAAAFLISLAYQDQLDDLDGVLGRKKARISELELELDIARKTSGEHSNRYQALERELIETKAEFVRELEEKDALFAAQISRFRQNIQFLSGNSAALEVLEGRKIGNLKQSRLSLETIIREQHELDGNRGALIASLEAVAMLTEDDINFGEADSRELRNRYAELTRLAPEVSDYWVKLANASSSEFHYDEIPMLYSRAAQAAKSPGERANALISQASYVAETGSYTMASELLEHAVEELLLIADSQNPDISDDILSATHMLAHFEAANLHFGSSTSALKNVVNLNRGLLDIYPDSDILKARLSDSINEYAMLLHSGGGEVETVDELLLEALNIRVALIKEGNQSERFWERSASWSSLALLISDSEKNSYFIGEMERLIENAKTKFPNNVIIASSTDQLQLAKILSENRASLERFNSLSSPEELFWPAQKSPDAEEVSSPLSEAKNNQ